MLKKPSTLADMKTKIMSALTALLLSLLYIVLGYAICAGIRAVPEIVASLSIEEDTSLFSKSDLVEGALAVRDYCFAEHDLNALTETIDSMNIDAQTGHLQSEVSDKPIDDRYVLDKSAIEHLDDVWNVAQSATYSILGIAILVAFCLLCTLFMFGTKALTRSFIWSGVVDISLLLILLVWALISFSSFFNVFHSLFFESGSWIFSADSLLITMLPENFWIGMGAIWIGITILLSTISIVFGVVMQKHVNKDHNSE